MTIYSLDILLSQFGTSLLLRVWFYLLLLDLHTIQISQEAGKVVWYSQLLKNFSQFVVIYTVKGFSIFKEAETDVFLEFSCFFYDPMDVGDLISGSSVFCKILLNIWKFSVSVQFSRSVMSDSLRPHESQHDRPPCPSQTPGVH